ncbi:MAG: hypothetical protein K1X81_11470 [Bacteroidia bacterium]|nr:hypothetical protein [Bacteroidia bacterium]
MDKRGVPDSKRLKIVWKENVGFRKISNEKPSGIFKIIALVNMQRLTDLIVYSYRINSESMCSGLNEQNWQTKNSDFTHEKKSVFTLVWDVKINITLYD